MSKDNFKNASNSVTINDSEKYINPYNFITLPETCEKKSYKERQGDLNGYMECKLTVETPIMIPDTEHVKVNHIEENKEHNEYVFFNYGDKKENFTVPVIPGSELRGMIRSDYETFTNSCMSTLSDDISFIARSNKRTGNLPGILVKDDDGNWKLYKATRYKLHTCRKNEGKPRPMQEIVKKLENDDKKVINENEKSDNKEINKNEENNKEVSKNEESNNNKKIKEAIYFVNEKNEIKINDKKYKTGDEVKFRAKKANFSVLEIGNGESSGILFIGETGGKKKGFNIHDSIFVKSEEEVVVEDLNEEVKKLKAIFDMYNDEAFNKNIKDKNKVWYDGYDIKNSRILPVWYSEPVNKKVYLSLASIGKEAYHRKITELVGSFMPCIDRENICNCCNLFGFVSKTDSDSSKIRISDAIYNSDEYPYDKQMIIKELSSPHIANATFYALYAPQTGFTNMPQTFDFNYDLKLAGKSIEEISKEDITIRGRKHYWHHKDIENAITKERTVRNCTITPVKAGTEFSFKIYFNNISQENLDELISIINLEYDNKNLSHKIGKGKPLGFGSCKIKVGNVYLRDVYIDENKLKYEMKEYNFRDKNISLKNFKDMDSISMQEALRIYDFDYIEKNYPEAKVTYPIGKKGDEENSMNWFMLNKSQNMADAYVIMVLPRIIDGKDEQGNENFGETEIKVKDQTLGKIHGLLLPKYEKAKK